MGLGHQGIAVHPQETVFELRLQRAQGIFDDELPTRVACRYVLVLGAEKANFPQREKLQIAVQGGADVRTGAGAFAFRRHRLEPGELCPGQRGGTLQRRLQARFADGLEQIVHRVCLYGRQRMTVVGGGEYHRRRTQGGSQVPCHLDTVHPRHADVQQYDVRRRLLHQAQGVGAVVRLADYFTGIEFRDHGEQP